MYLRSVIRLLLAGLVAGSALLTPAPRLLDPRLPTLDPPSAHADGPGDWPMFGHDPARTGYGGGGAPLPPLRLKWTYQQGASADITAPVVANGVIYVVTYDFAEPNEAKRYALYALEAATGTVKWRYGYGTGVNYLYFPPTVANGVVYVVVGGWNDPDRLHAIDAQTGAVRCRRELPVYRWFLDPPAVAGGLVYVATTEGVYALYAPEAEYWWYGCLDVMWHYSTGPLATAPAVANGVVYVASADKKVYALDAATGSLKWSYDTGTSALRQTAVASGMVYVTSDGYVYALDAETGALKWTYQGGLYPSSLAVANGVVYVINHTEWMAYALDAATGALKWRMGGGAQALAVADGIVYVVSDSYKRIYVLDAATGAPKWSYEIAGHYFPPAVADGVVYVAASWRRLYAFEAQPPPVSLSVPPYVPASSFAVSWTVPIAWTGTAAASYDVQYRDGASGAWTDLITATTALSTTFSGQEGHTYYFQGRSRTATGLLGDYAAGDGDTHTTIDLTPPTGSITINNGTAYATGITATLNLTATDATSGVAGVSFSNDGSSWSSWNTYAPTRAWLLASGDGPKTVYGRFRDLAGNVSAVYSDTIVLDTTAPETPAPDDGVTGVTSKPSVTFAWPAVSDNLSGVEAYNWKTDCGPETATTVLTATTSVLPDGQHTFYVRARDGAGNYSPYGKHAFAIKATSLDPPSLDAPGSPTNREKISVSGRATAGATVRLYLNCAYYGQATSGSGGAWQFQDVPLALGENVIMASIVDSGGGLSPISLPVVVVRLEGQSTPPAPAAAGLVGPSGGTISSGNFAVEIPAGALGGQAQVVVTPYSEVSAPWGSPPGKRFVGSFASISALEKDSGAPAQLLKAVRVSLPYDPQALGFIRPENLAVHYYDTDLSTWGALPSQVDTANRRVTAEASHLTHFALLAGGMGTWAVFVPVVLRAYAGW